MRKLNFKYRTQIITNLRDEIISGNVKTVQFLDSRTIIEYFCWFFFFISKFFSFFSQKI